MAVKVVRPEDRRLEPVAGGDPGVKLEVVTGPAPYAHLAEVPAGQPVGLHSHSETEVMVVLSGAAHLGDTVCGAGSVLVVDADEEYAFDAGPDGPLVFLVVRPRKADFQRATTGAR